MKAFWISIILFIILIGCIVSNAIYIRKVTDYVTYSVEVLAANESDRKEGLEKLELFWGKHKNIIGLSVGFRELDHFGEIMVGLRWAYDEGDEREFRKYCSLLLDALEEISRSERISIGNIF